MRAGGRQDVAGQIRNGVAITPLSAPYNPPTSTHPTSCSKAWDTILLIPSVAVSVRRSTIRRCGSMTTPAGAACFTTTAQECTGTRNHIRSRRILSRRSRLENSGPISRPTGISAVRRATRINWVNGLTRPTSTTGRSSEVRTTVLALAPTGCRRRGTSGCRDSSRIQAALIRTK